MKQIEPNDRNPRGKKSFPIVGIGASAGGLEAIETFFAHMPTGVGMAFVVIQHLSPQHKSILGDILKKDTSMQVIEVEDGMHIVPNCIYLNPPDKEIGIFNGIFRLVKPDQSRKIRLPIDYFFRSLADEQAEKAICIILSGTGSDGTLGLEAVKGVGGLTMAQAEQQAKYPGMPRSAVDTGMVDLVLPVEKMPGELVNYVKQPYLEGPETITGEGLRENFLPKILMLIRSLTGHDFSHYKLNTICRRIERRMALHKLARIADYHRYLQENPPEVKALFKDLLIRVTSFFRDPAAFEVLAAKVIPGLLESKGGDANVRVWVPACASGEESLSLAMIMAEAVDRLGKPLNVQIFGTDIDADAIERARLGEYPESIAADVSPERLQRFFIKKDGNYKIKKQIREMVLYAVQNLTSDPPFTKLDLISCRNVLIYMNAPIQKKILPLFHFTLNPEGYLFLGSSETIGAFSDLFTPIDVKWKIFQRKGLVIQKRAAYPPIGFMPTSPGTELTIKRVTREMNVRELMGRIILDKYAPPSVLVNDRYEILYFQGKTGQYLAPPSGEPSFNILKMAREGLRYKLTAALRQAVNEKRTVSCQGVQLKQKDDWVTVDLHIQPLLETPEAPANLFLVVFEEKSPARPKGKGRKPPPEAEEADSRLTTLEQELQATKEYLESTIEELGASNEELQSANEELQSTNEELETAREELQSTNEELVSVNSELQTKIDDLEETSSDINNLFTTTEVGIIFLDIKLGIRRFTPNMTQFFNLIPADVGRSLRDITSKTAYDHICQDAEEVLATLQTKEREIKAGVDGTWYNMRILPYRTLENMIDGVVLTFVDITERKRMEGIMQAAQLYAESIVDTVREPLLVLNGDLMVVSANRSFYRMFRTSPAEAENRRIYDLGSGQWNIPSLRELLGEIVVKNNSFEDFAVEVEFPGQGRKKMLLNACQIPGGESQPGLILLAMEDITDKRPY
jgi:two-component system, chemotaxis family, CheB/CheR fusion protein